MALKKLLADLSIISKLGTNPGIDDGLSEEHLKAKFDEAANLIKDYLNNYLILEIEKTVDVESLLADILDVTLSKKDKAANAAATGEAIRGLRSFFEKVVHGGDYVLESDGCFAAEVVSYTTVHVDGGVGVIHGNLFSLEAQDVLLQDGTYGLYRNDLIVVRCTKGETGSLSYALVALTGANTSGEPVDPEYLQSDINADGTIHDFPLYRVRIEGLDIATIVPLFTAEKPFSEQKKLSFYNTAVPTSSFIADTTYADYPFRAAVTLSGVIVSMIPEVIFRLEDAVSGNFAPVAAAYDGGVYIYAAEQPTADVTIPTIICWREA